jgi:integrase/recombinase XerD
MPRRTEPGDPRRRHMARADWPEPDRLLWEELLRPAPTPFDTAGRGAHWSPMGMTLREQSYGHWLSWLAHEHPTSLGEPPIERFSSDRLTAFVRFALTLVAPNTIRMRAGSLLGLAIAAEPQRDWSDFRRLVQSVNRLSRPLIDKGPRLRHPRALLQVGLELMDEASRSAGSLRPTQRQAALYRDGLMIALLASRPLRRRNLMDLVLGRSLIETRDGGFDIRFEHSDSKAKQRIDLPLPQRLIDPMRRYLATFRPVLVARNQDCGALWIAARTGGPLSAHGAYNAVCTRTKAAFGQALNLHLFRDCVATSIAIDDPVSVRSVTALLGHTTIATANEHYNQAGMLSAGRLHDEAIRRERRCLRAVDDGRDNRRGATGRRRRPRQLRLFSEI